MRTFVVLVAFLVSVAAHAQADPATQERLRMDGAAGGTGARVPSEATGGATVIEGDQHRHTRPTASEPQPGKARDEELSERTQGRNTTEKKEGQNTQRADAEPSDPAAKARLQMEGAAGGTGARIPEDANGGATAGPGHQHRN